MKRLTLAIALSLILTSYGLAQVSLFLTPSNQFGFKSENVWDLTLTNLNDESIKVYFDATIQNDQQKEIVHLTSEVVSIPKGSMQFNSIVLSTVSKSYRDEDASVYEAMTGELPPGVYQYCVQLVCVDQQCMEVVGFERSIKQCETIEKETITPLMLAIPEDEAKLSTTRPDFSWIAPMPIGGNPELTYRIKLVELTEDQSPEDGIKRNRALYQASEVFGTSLPFPQELEDLVVGQNYGWQVEAWLGRTFVAVSEAWEFEVEEDEEEFRAMPYVRLKKTDVSTYNAVNNLKFIYNEPLRQNTLAIHFYDAQGIDVTPEDVLFQTRFGDNKFNLDMRRYDFVSGKDYKMEITAPNGEKYSLKFKYIFQFID